MFKDSFISFPHLVLPSLLDSMHLRSRKSPNCPHLVCGVTVPDDKLAIL